MGILYDSYFFRGNGDSPYQVSSFIRAYNETRCNDMAFPVGTLQDFDLKWFRNNGIHPVVLRKVIELAQERNVILYAIMHYSEKNKKRVIDGYIVTDTNYQLLYQNNQGSYNGFGWDYMQKAVRSIIVKKEN